ncbi:PHB depolymerase family esterase [soil metagenome]
MKVLLVALIFVNCLSALSQGLIDHTIAIDGRERQYLTYVPAALDNSKKYPLVIVLHGGGGNAKQMIEFSGFTVLAEKEKIILLYPNGYKKGWNDGRVAPDIKSNTENVDDVKFISTLIDQLSSSLLIDTKRIFVTGISNGAMMSLYLAYKIPEKIRAIAPVSGSIPENISASYQLSVPVSLLVINGTADGLVPYMGGPVLSKRAHRGSVISTQEMINLWKTFAKKPSEAYPINIENKDPNDGCTADRFVYSSEKEINIELIRVNNGGHTWPGGKQYLPKMIVGKVCRDFKAEEVIWNFFDRQTAR